MKFKYSGGIPLWMTQVLSQEKIYKTSFSKYGTAYQMLIFPQTHPTNSYHMLEVAVSVGNRSAGTEITRKDKDGNTLIAYAPELSFAVVILSSPELVKGETYTITAGNDAGEFAAS